MLGMTTGETIKVLDEGYVKLINAMGDDETVIRAARQSTDGSFVSWAPYDGHPKGDLGLLRYLYKNEHSTPFEMCELMVEVQLPIFVAREWMRHRTFSYNEASARYAVMPNKHYVPPKGRIVKQSMQNKQASGNEYFDEDTVVAILDHMHNEQQLIYMAYVGMTDSGVSREIARINTPVSRYTRFWCKGNLRNWLHFLKLRMASNAQQEIRDYANAVAHLVAQRWPRTWELFKEFDLDGMRLSRSEAEKYRRMCIIDR